MPTSSPKPDVIISAAEANRGFSRVLREVRDGASYVVTAHGRPVARVTPYAAPEDPKAEARALLFEHLRTVKPMEPGLSWTREELYDDI